MKLLKPPRLELYSFLFSMPLVGVAANLILYKERTWTDIRIWLISFPLICLIGCLSWYTHVCYDDFIEKKFPELNQSPYRIGWKAMVILLIMSPSMLLIFFVYDYFNILGYSLENLDLMKGLLLGLSVNLIFETLYEGDYILFKYKEGVAEKEILQELATQQEFDTLKNQVNPHFLFNCFNTLSSLISIDKEKAEQFLDELSKVYRYLLRNNEDGLSTLENEIKFIDSYYQLLRTRHSDSVKLNIAIDNQYNTYLLPSLTLQLLVENAVKHNSHSKSSPLVVDIFTTAGNKLVVSNNLLPRTIKALSNKVGLENIRAKFDILRTPGFQVLEDEKNFTVVLPLLWKNKASKE